MGGCLYVIVGYVFMVSVGFAGGGFVGGMVGGVFGEGVGLIGALVGSIWGAVAAFQYFRENMFG